MKTAISLPDPLFEELDRVSKRLGKPRSTLVAQAIRELLDRMPSEDDVTTAYDAALDEARRAGWEEDAEVAFLRHAAAGTRIGR